MPISGKRLHIKKEDSQVYFHEARFPSLIVNSFNRIARLSVPALEVIQAWNMQNCVLVEPQRQTSEQLSCDSDRIVFVESKEDLIVKSVAESQPIHRFLQVVQNNRYEEAKELARKYELDQEYALKAKVEFILREIENDKDFGYDFEGILVDIAGIHDNEYLMDMINSKSGIETEF